MSALIRAKDWSKTSLGSPDSWPPSLSLIVSVTLASGFPMAVRWGPEFVMIYNDGYRPILGDKHPWALGLPFDEVWPEVQRFNRGSGLCMNPILSGKRSAFFAEDLLLRISFHHQPKAQHPKSSAINKLVGRLPHLSERKRTSRGDRERVAMTRTGLHTVAVALMMVSTSRWRMRAASGVGADIGGNHCRISAHGFGYAIGDDPAGIENRDPFRQRHYKSHMMFDEQNRYSRALNVAHNAG